MSKCSIDERIPYARIIDPAMLGVNPRNIPTFQSRELSPRVPPRAKVEGGYLKRASAQDATGIVARGKRGLRHEVRVQVDANSSPILSHASCLPLALWGFTCSV